MYPAEPAGMELEVYGNVRPRIACRAKYTLSRSLRRKRLLAAALEFPVRSSHCTAVAFAAYFRAYPSAHNEKIELKNWRAFRSTVEARQTGSFIYLTLIVQPISCRKLNTFNTPTTKHGARHAAPQNQTANGKLLCQRRWTIARRN